MPRQAQTNKQRCGTSLFPKKTQGRSRKVAEMRKDSIAACDRRILEFPLSTSSKTVAKILKAEGWYGPKTTIYYIEFRVRRLRGRRQSGDVQAK
jgi:hypothetical protein